MTILSPNLVNTTLLQDGQAAGSITPAVMRTVVDSLAGIVPSTPITGASRTLIATDRDTVIEFNSASPQQLIVPTNASVGFDVGTVIGWYQHGTGQLSIVAATPATTLIRTSSSANARTQYSSGTLRKRATDEWVLSGDVV
jgi:hypothetical protein